MVPPRPPESLMRRLSPLVLLLALACRTNPDDGNKGEPDADTGALTADADGDGYAADEDCDDTDASVNPGAEEVCDEVDNDCDDEVDEGVTGTWYADADGDGFGDAGAPAEGCDQPDGYTADDTDCDDADDAVFPAAPERCDGLDNDCDGSIDEDVQSTWFADADADGFGDAASPLDDCDPPDGYAATDDDCDDADPAVNPSADEVCNDVDDDCDGTIDEDATDARTFYGDADGDGYGDPGAPVLDCEPPSGAVEDATDCNDGQATINPGATELCNRLDDDCDGTIDEDDAADAATWYADADGDGYGDASSPSAACDAPSGTVADDTDCDDTDAAVSPAGLEVCNGIDDDCDGATDDADADVDRSTGTDWYVDADGDGYGGTTTTTTCSQPSGTTATQDDCDDADAAVNPAAAEVCDGADNDCDGDIDDDDASLDASTGGTFHVDGDGDGYGGATTTTTCSQPAGTTATLDDCDDADAAVNPAASEICNGIDDDCDGDIDDADASVDRSTGTAWYVDGDGDGYGGATTTTTCSQPAGTTATLDDCDDADAAVNPAASEICNGIDDDCDGDIDDADASIDLSTALEWYADTDADGYGDASRTATACAEPSGFVSDDQDCDDARADVNPGADEVCDGATDEDCDGTTDEDDAIDAATWYADADLDGFGDAAASTTACVEPSGYVSDATDCDDGDVAVNPAADEVCDGSTDEDCDGDVDEDDAIDAATWYADADADGFGDASRTTTACDEPSGYSDDATDCDDTDGAVYPLAGDVYADGVDQDCDGLDCEADWSGAAYFAVCFDPATWSDGRDDCQAAGHDDLASVRDATEQADIYGLLSDAGLAGSKSPWIGFNDLDTDGTWVWSDGWTGSYTHWNSGEPNGGTAENCAELNWRQGTGLWNDSTCDDDTLGKRSYVCQTR